MCLRCNGQYENKNGCCLFACIGVGRTRVCARARIRKGHGECAGGYRHGKQGEPAFRGQARAPPALRLPQCPQALPCPVLRTYSSVLFRPLSILFLLSLFSFFGHSTRFFKSFAPFNPLRHSRIGIIDWRIFA